MRRCSTGGIGFFFFMVGSFQLLPPAAGHDRWAAQGRNRMRSSPLAVALQLSEDPGDLLRNSSNEENACFVYSIRSIPGDENQDGDEFNTIDW